MTNALRYALRHLGDCPLHQVTVPSPDIQQGCCLARQRGLKNVEGYVGHTSCLMHFQPAGLFLRLEQVLYPLAPAVMGLPFGASPPYSPSEQP